MAFFSDLRGLGRVAQKAGMSKDFSECNSSRTLVRGLGLCAGSFSAMLKEEPGDEADAEEQALRDEMQAAVGICIHVPQFPKKDSLMYVEVLHVAEAS